MCTCTYVCMHDISICMHAYNYMHGCGSVSYVHTYIKSFGLNPMYVACFVPYKLLRYAKESGYFLGC